MNGQGTIIMAAIIHMLYVRFPCSLFPYALLKFVPFFFPWSINRVELNLFG